MRTVRLLGLRAVRHPWWKSTRSDDLCPVRRWVKPDIPTANPPFLQFVAPWLRRVAAGWADSGLAGIVCYITNTPNGSSPMLNNWNDTAPIYRQLAQQLAGQLLDGEPKEGRVVLQVARQGDAFVLSIFDNGPGFPQQDRDRFVEPYVTTRAKGTGLGLAIVQRIIEDHGGALTLGDAPAPAAGALVQIILPIRRDATPAATTANG